MCHILIISNSNIAALCTNRNGCLSNRSISSFRKYLTRIIVTRSHKLQLSVMPLYIFISRKIFCFGIKFLVLLYNETSSKECMEDSVLTSKKGYSISIAYLISFDKQYYIYYVGCSLRIRTEKNSYSKINLVAFSFTLLFR